MSVAKQPNTAKELPVVEIEHWVDYRFPKDHPFYSRWSIVHHGESVLTFETEGEARAAADSHGWIVRRASVERAA